MKKLTASTLVAMLLTTTGLTHARVSVPQSTHKPVLEPITIDDTGSWTSEAESDAPDTLAAKKKKKPKKKKKTKAS